MEQKNTPKTTQESYQRHDISDELWNLLEPHLPGKKGTRGGQARDNRLFLNAIFWIFRTGAPWRDLPPYYGDWKNTHRRFCRWRDKGIWEKLFKILSSKPELEWLVIDSSYIKAPPDSSGGRGGNQQMNRTKGVSIRSCI